jgi:shikimate kinase
MASGKTTIGRRLAKRLDWTFVDLDEAVTTETGRTIAELFAEGEEAFRREEYRTLKKVSRGGRRVIALGGGALQWGNALDFVKARGLLVYLSVDTDTLLKRLKQVEAARPLVVGSAGSELRRLVEQLLAQRRPYYESAAVIVDCGDRRSEESIVEELLHVLERRMSADPS